ncbi:MAG TPA: hypothetical protein DCL54_17815, partial [Alphaproteobacteria bacterium]|nr:hypothetical protein [Alphaproteobacteria bacterium]
MRVLLAVILGAASVSTAIASESVAPEKKDWRLTVGAGGLYRPDYQGSNEYEFTALPFLAGAYQDWLTFQVPEGLKAAVIVTDTFKAGVLAGVRFSRDAGDNIALAGWGDVDTAFELGGFAEYTVGPVTLGLDVRGDVSGAHEGFIAKASARYNARFGWARLSVGPEIQWADDNYTQTYFGITPVQAAASVLGYAPYAADGGINSYGFGAVLIVPLSKEWSITAIGSVSQLTGDAADSPIVAQQGSETQFT